MLFSQSLFIIFSLFFFFRVNCSFYFKIGACRHGDRCSRLHNKPTFSQVRVLEWHAFCPPWDGLILSVQMLLKFSTVRTVFLLYFFRRLPFWTFIGTLRTVPSLQMVWLVSVHTSACFVSTLSIVLMSLSFISRCNQWHGDAGALWWVFWGRNNVFCC